MLIFKQLQAFVECKTAFGMQYSPYNFSNKSSFSTMINEINGLVSAISNIYRFFKSSNSFLTSSSVIFEIGIPSSAKVFSKSYL